MGAKADVHREMDRLAGEGVAILMISSDLQEVLAMSDRVVVMRGGTVAGIVERRAHARARPAPRARGGRRVNDASGIFARARRPGVYLRELGTAAALGLLLLVLIAVAPQFFSAGNLRDLAVANAPVLIIAIGMTLVLLTGHVDISVGSHFAVCSVAAALLARTGLPMPLVLASVILVGALLGAINGLFVARLGLPSVVVTLATMVIWRDSLRWVTEGAWVQDLPAGFQWFGLAQRTGEWAIVLAALGVLLAGAYGLRSLAAGRAIYAVGPTTKPHAWWACAPISWCSGSSPRSARARRWPRC